MSNNQDIWLISSNSITEELIDSIASSIYDKNILNITINLNTFNISSFNHIKQQLYAKYIKKFKNKESSLFEEMIFNNESLNRKLLTLVQKNKEKEISQIKDLINKSRMNINAGKIINKAIIYDFKNNIKCYISTI